MATLQSTKKAIAKKRADSLYNAQQVADFKAKKRTKQLNNEQACLLAVQQGKGKEAILNICKKAYATKVFPTGTTASAKKTWIAGRAKIYFSIATYQHGVVVAEMAKVEKVTATG
jgi:hypothetical protein